MCDFSFLKECFYLLKTEIKNNSNSELKEKLNVILEAVDSQILSLENFVENESRKKVLALERVQELESEVQNEKEKRKMLETFGTKLSEQHIRETEERKEKIILAHEARNVAQEVLRVCYELRYINKKLNSKVTKDQLNHIEKMWESTRVKQIVPNSLVISLETNSTLLDAINIASVVMAVYETTNEEVKGLITIADIISYLELTIGPDCLEKELMELADEEKVKSNKFGQISVTSVIEASSVPYFPVFLNASISNLLNVFNQDIPYIPICDEDHMIVNIVSQGFLVNILATQLNSFHPAIVNKSSTLKELGLVDKTRNRTITVRKNSKAIDALLLLGTLKREAIAIIDEKDILVGSLNLTDFKGIYSKEIPKLFLPITEFIAVKEIMIPIVATKKHQLKDIISMFVQHKSENIWIVDKKKKPIGLLYITDILNMLDIEWDKIGWTD